MVSARSTSSDGGFTLVEVVLSTALLAVAALGVAQLFVFASTSNLNSRGQTSTAVLAAQKMEQLRGLAWGFVEGPGGSLGNTLADTTTDLSVDPPTSGGTGLLPSPGGTLDRNVPLYVDYLDAGGQWVGTGATPPPSTVYIRRWSIEPLPAAPNDALVLQVVVTTLRRELRRSQATAPGTLWEDTRLVSIKTRRAL